MLQQAISETCVNMKKCILLWTIQGIRYQRRHIAWSEFSAGRGKGAVLKIAESLREAEAQTLHDRYMGMGNGDLKNKSY